MEIKYPIFLQDRDKYVYMVSSISEINRELEAIDIEEKEYSAWDVEGIPLELYLDQDEIKVRIFSNVSQRDALKEALFDYAKLVRSKAPFIYSGPENNMIELFKAIEEYVKTVDFTHKLKRFFKK